MNYKKFTDKELFESYSTAMDYSGKPDKDILAEIDNRGGIDQITRNIEQEDIVPNEIKRIRKLVFSLKQTNSSPDKIKSTITSDILSVEELNRIIELEIGSIDMYVKDTSINSRTILGSIIGMIISGTIGAGLWCYSIILTGMAYYALTPIILIISYVLIRLITGQSRNNALVFIATFCSAFIAIPLGFWIYRLLRE